MYTHVIVLPDGTEFSSGAGQTNVIQNVTITQSVNSDTELTLGSTCSTMLEAQLFTPNGGVNIDVGTEITLYRVNEAGTREKMGLFTLETPSRPSANCYKITAYDRVSWLDKDLSNWLAALDSWPYRLDAFAKMICEACGLTLVESEMLNGDYMVQQFIGEGVTGRQLIKWVGEACAKFCRATPDGKIEFAWYKETDLQIAPSGDVYYFSGGLKYEDYKTAPIEQVQIRLTEDDIGVWYPKSSDDLTVYAITANYLLTATESATLEPIAQNIYNFIKGISYKPYEVKIPVGTGVSAGDIVHITDLAGNVITAYVMSRTQKGQADTLKATGSNSRGSSTAVNDVSMGALNARMMEIKKSIEGLNVKASNLTTAIENNKKDTDEKISEINVEAGEIKASVTETRTELTTTTENVYDALGRLQDTAVSTEELESVKQLLITQWSDQLEYRFTQVTNLINSTNGTIAENQRLLEQYIRFEGARITLGRSDSAIQAVLSNDRLEFVENGQTVAYISNRMLYITDAHITGSLSFGNADTGLYMWRYNAEADTFDLEFEGDD